MTPSLIAGSFRDPSGFVYTRDGALLRQVNRCFGDEFDAFVASGLYDELVDAELLIPHRVAPLALAARDEAHAVLEPEQVPFISYPYEWAFGQLRDAALLTLEIQRRALARGFTLRDASAYNVQFRGARPVFIDTLSFERHRDGRPWSAYKQFCEHFLAPLALMSRRDVRLGHLLRRFLDGVPLELASAMLPVSSWASVGLLIHVHLHARAQRRYEDASVASVAKGRAIGTTALGALVNSLDATVRDLQWKPEGTTWADYTSDTNYTDQAARAKRDLVARFLEHARPATVWDLGANTGDYSRLARQSARTVISFDIDPAAVERNYLRARADGDRGLLPLLMDITNPSPAQGWGHAERMSLAERGPADVVMALALVHHLAIGGNVPLASIARCFAGLGERLIIELVPKADSQVQRLLRNRPDIFPEYTREGFERAFLERFRILEVQPVEGSERWLYMMVRREESTS
jgi:ribosomal protein L11 methylase PrmA